MTDPLLADFSAFAAALAQPGEQPEAGFAALWRLAQPIVGAKIFTVLGFDLAGGTMRRVFTSAPELYPAGGVDALADSVWERTLIGEQRPLVLNDFAALAGLLPEAEKLRGRGCEAMLNLPVVVGGEVLGAVNMLEASGHYDAARVTAAAALVPGAASLLLWGKRA